MLSSLRCGIRGLPIGVKMFFLCPGDIATVSPQTIRTLAAAYQETEEHLLYPVYDGERGHPILLSFPLAAEILTGEWPEGLRTLLSRHAGLDVACSDPGILRDMDTPEDYGALKKAYPAAPDYLGFAEELLRRQPLPDHLLAHCDKVASVAQGLTRALNEKGQNFDADLVTAAGRIHDFAKGQKGHAPIGRQRLLEQDQPELAVLVGAHMGDGIDPAKSLSEKDILYLADKMVKGDRFVGIHGRFTAAYEKYGYLPQLQQREKKARAIAGKVEAILGVSPETYCKEK